MCGRFTMLSTSDELARLFGFETADLPDLPRRYNVAPTQLVPAVRLADDGRRVLVLLRWGLIPAYLRTRPAARNGGAVPTLSPPDSTIAPCEGARSAARNGRTPSAASSRFADRIARGAILAGQRRPGRTHPRRVPVLRPAVGEAWPGVQDSHRRRQAPPLRP